MSVLYESFQNCCDIKNKRINIKKSQGLGFNYLYRGRQDNKEKIAATVVYGLELYKVPVLAK